MDVLLVRAGALGDVVLLRVAVSALRRAGHGVRLLAPATPGSVLVGPGEADALFALDGAAMAAALSGEPPADAALALRADATVALTRSPDLLETLERFTPRLLARDPEPPPGTHAAWWLAAPVRDLGAADGTLEPPAPMRFTAEEQRAVGALAAALPAGFLAIHPGSGRATKNWPAARFAGLVRARTSGKPWLLVKGPADDEAAAALAGVPDAVCADGLPPRGLGALLSAAGLYVGNDSGVSHLAAAAGAPTLALFGPTEPATWAPVGPRVGTVRSPDGTMAGLSLEAVLQAAEALFRSTTPHP